MNGYDFDLFFTGTKIDFHEIEKAFARAGASKKVRIIHKNELEDPLTKSAEIDNLLLWLKNHPNNRFPYQAFMEENQDLFEGLYPYYVINGPIPSEIKTDNISIESVKSAEKLPSDLSNVPILFYIDDHNDNQFRKDLEYQIVSDYILSNVDRHMDNIGILRDAESLKFIRMAPIFDTGRAFGGRGVTPYTDEEIDAIEINSFEDTEAKMLTHVTDRKLFDLNKALHTERIRELYNKDSKMKQGRIKNIMRVYEKKLERVDKWQKKGR